MGPAFSALLRFRPASPFCPPKRRRCGGTKSGTCTSAGAQTSMSMSSSAKAARCSCSAALASARGSSSDSPRGRNDLSVLGGNRDNNGESAEASAPNATASRRRAAVPAGASFITLTSAAGTSARGASSGSETQSWRAHRQRRNRISAGSLSWAKAKSCGQEKPRSHRGRPPTMRGNKTPRRQRPLSAMDSTANESIGDACFPGSFGTRLKNCNILEDVCCSSAPSSSSTSSSPSSPPTLALPAAGLEPTQEAPRPRATFAAAATCACGARLFPAMADAASSKSSSSSKWRPCCLKASTNIQPNAHCTSRTGSRRCSSKKTWPRPSNQLQSGSTTMWRSGKGTTDNALAALRISSLSREPPLCTKAQSAIVRAATAARARKRRLSAALRVPELSSGLTLRSSWRSKPQWLLAVPPSRTQNKQIAVTAATSTSSESAGKATTGAMI
mmetsp:Transcript_110626/g.277122  ORF Transcript_110626/g.277122 Transcript_110626/m.277122 type:complete len:445 (-) Transcript_110626:1971-3305(-)